MVLPIFGNITRVGAGAKKDDGNSWLTKKPPKIYQGPAASLACIRYPWRSM